MGLAIFDLLNSMNFDLKRSVDLRWFFDLVLHSSLDDLVNKRKRWLFEIGPTYLRQNISEKFLQKWQVEFNKFTQVKQYWRHLHIYVLCLPWVVAREIFPFPASKLWPVRCAWNVVTDPILRKSVLWENCIEPNIQQFSCLLCELRKQLDPMFHWMKDAGSN